jgi:hypothetical protein
MTGFKSIVLFIFLASAILANAQNNSDAVNIQTFKEPPATFRGVRWLGFGLSNLSDSSVIKSIDKSVSLDSWGSYLLGPGGGPTTGLSEAYLKASHRATSEKGVVYLSEEYFRLYKLAIAEGMKHNFSMSTLYDEWNYPSGIVGGQFYSKYPELSAKSLEMVEKNVSGPVQTTLEIPEGIYIGAVMMNMDNFRRIDISKQLFGKTTLKCSVPKGSWKVMGFYLNTAFRPQSQKGGFVDYLDKEAVAKYIEMNFEPYYTHLKEYFGTVIKRTMYDEPAMHLMDGRMWTPHFNREFEKKFHYSPMIYYPALWYNIGEETAAARNALFGFHADLFAENYIGQMAEWCAKHGINLGGHLDQEEARNPVAINGDLMKAFRHQQVPGHDDIYYPGRSNVSYKIIASACYNYDRPEFITETYAAYRAMSTTIAMRTALDQFTMGVNVQLGSRPADIGPVMDRFVGRASYLLRGGRHVADIAVVYPIAALQSAYSFAGPKVSSRKGSSAEMYYALEGGIVPPETDYMNIGEMLFRSLRVDYTWLHPDILVEKCTVVNKQLKLNNSVNREDYRVLILPGGDTFSAEASKKVLEFYRGGGTVIATSKLPLKSAEFNRDKDVRDMVTEVFGISDNNPMTAEIAILVDNFTSYFMNPNKAGGRGYFLPNPELKVMETVLKEALPVKDVDIKEAPMWPLKMGTAYDGALTYIHKVRDERNIYFFANSSDKAIETEVALRGDLKSLEIWDPHTGKSKKAETLTTTVNDQKITTFKLNLPPVSSLFYVQTMVGDDILSVTKY